MSLRDFEAVVVGSGFAGAVTACRLAQAGIDVCLLERGRRYERNDFPTYPFESRSLKRQQSETDTDEYEPPRDFSRWLWRVDQGLWDVRDLGRVKAAQAAGYGGGSLVYASVHLRAPAAVFETPARSDPNCRLWPAFYRRAPADGAGSSLDDYYNLAAFMLDVQKFPHEDLAKTSRLREAAANGNWFLPPLAVNFSERPRTRRLHDRQGQCDLRGFCSIGCGIQAKNTLDLNYLAVAENPTLSLADNPTRHKHDNSLAVHVVTLAEVTGLKRPERSSDEFPFELTYRDLLLKSAESTVRAKSVFLCAGALNTTELLCASQDDLHLPNTTREWLGRGYYTNGDALAVVFDCEKPHEVDRGPTITAALQYDIDGNWFLVEDGGVPDELDLVLGVFRSPLWLRRNRFREHGPHAEQESLRRYRRMRSTGARELLAALPPHGAEPVQGVLAPKLPRWLEKALKIRGAQLLQRFSLASEPLAEQTLDQLALYLQRRLDAVAEILPNGKALLQGATDLGLARGLLRLGAQLMWGSESDAVRRAVETLLRRAPRNLDDITRAFVSVLRWCADYHPGDGRSGVLLTMGRDNEPTTLKYDADAEDNSLIIDEEATAKEPKAAAATAGDPKGQPKREPLYVTQERVFRDIAREWKGELRTNPTWTLARSHITVHSQGGCRMSVAAKDGVTNADGEVFGCKGLYVMDAAAFPSPVGVNPSATIAAVAERKIEQFIRTLPGKSDWRAPEWREAQEWAKREAAMLDPLAHVGAVRKTKAEVIGLTFQERMQGHYASVAPRQRAGWVSELRAEVRSEDRGLSRASLDRWHAGFATAELKGIRNANEERADLADDFARDGEIAVELDAKIDDLSAFLDREYSRKPADPGVTIELSGNVFFGKDARPYDAAAGRDTREKHPITHATLQLFRAARAKRRKALEYVLTFQYRGKPYRLHGLKVIEDDPRLDVWHDASTLNFDIEDLTAGEKKWRGVLRLPAAEFLEAQVKSFDVTGTDDPDRKMWALGAFLAFFSGHLVDSYVPELKNLPALLRNLLLRTHG